MTVDGPIRIGVSSCLLGERVRFDGGHKGNDFLTEVMGPHVEWVPVCPELEMGLGVPREPIQLERKNGKIRLVSIDTRADRTKTMLGWAKQRLGELDRENLSGYVFKSRSPSCGVAGVPIHAPNAARVGYGQGLYARALMERFGNLPIVEDSRLGNPALRENFIERVFACRRLRRLFDKRWKKRDVTEFHTRHKLVLMAHSPRLQRRIERLAAQIAKSPREQLRTRYESLFMQTMKVIPTPAKHTEVLKHMAGFLTDRLDSAQKSELGRLIDEYRQDLDSLNQPLARIRCFARRFGVEDLNNQLYLSPDPEEVALRDRVRSFP